MPELLCGLSYESKADGFDSEQPNVHLHYGRQEKPYCHWMTCTDLGVAVAALRGMHHGAVGIRRAAQDPADALRWR